MGAGIIPEFEYTPAEWQQIARNAIAALKRNANNVRAREALQAAIPRLDEFRRAASALEREELLDPGALASLGLGISSGATAGFGDELAGLVAGAGALVPGGMSPGEAMREQTATTRFATGAAREEHPLPYWTGDLGALLGPGGLAAQGAKAIPRGAGLAARVASRLGRGAATGGLLGGAVSAGEAEGPLAERLPAAGLGAGLGAAAGAAVPAASAILTETASPVGRYIARVAQRLGGKSSSKVSEQLAAERLRGAQLRNQLLERKLGEAQPGGAYAPASAAPSEAAAAVEEALTPRVGQTAPGGGRFATPGPTQLAGPGVRVQSPPGPTAIPSAIRIMSDEQLLGQIRLAQSMGTPMSNLRLAAEELARRGLPIPAITGSVGVGMETFSDPLMLPEAQSEVLRQVLQELEQVSAAKQQVTQQSPLITATIPDERVTNILRRPAVKRVLRKYDLTIPEPPPTGGEIETVRQVLRKELGVLVREGEIRQARSVGDALDDLTRVLDENSPQFRTIREQYGPVARRERELLRLQRYFSRGRIGAGLPEDAGMLEDILSLFGEGPNPEGPMPPGAGQAPGPFDALTQQSPGPIPPR